MKSHYKDWQVVTNNHPQRVLKLIKKKLNIRPNNKIMWGSLM